MSERIGSLQNFCQTADEFFVGGAGDTAGGTHGEVFAPDGIVPLQPCAADRLANGMLHTALIHTMAQSSHSGIKLFGEPLLGVAHICRQSKTELPITVQMGGDPQQM